MRSSVVFNSYGRIAADIAAGVDAAIVETATAIEQDIKGAGPHAAPIDTGNLRRSYHQDRKGLDNPVDPTVEVGNDPSIADYAGYVEYGTSRMAAQPHLTPASEAQKEPHAARVAAAVAAGAARGVRHGGGIGEGSYVSLPIFGGSSGSAGVPSGGLGLAGDSGEVGAEEGLAESAVVDIADLGLDIGLLDL
jgi:HK97 gp10 family phage protein